MPGGIKMMQITECIQCYWINFEGIMYAVTLGLFVIQTATFQETH